MTMVDFPVIDTHVHVWNLERFRYPWLDDCACINRTFLLKDFDEARKNIEIEKMVFVQCECLPSQHLDELRWFQSMTDEDERIQGIVPWAPLEDGEKFASELEVISTDPRVKGFRRIIQFEPDIDFCVKPGFIRGVQLLGEFELHFEITISPTQTPNIIKLIEVCPNVKFVLDHIGNPDIAGGVIEPWASYINELARFENVWCKVSGLATNADLQNWKAEDFTPYLDTIFEAFGIDMVMYAGDWPHSLRATEYTRWFETLYQYAKPLSKSDHRKLFHDNAIDFYRL